MCATQAGGYYLGMLAYFWVLATPAVGFLFGAAAVLMPSMPVTRAPPLYDDKGPLRIETCAHLHV